MNVPINIVPEHVVVNPVEFTPAIVDYATEVKAPVPKKIWCTARVMGGFMMVSGVAIGVALGIGFGLYTGCK